MFFVCLVLDCVRSCAVDIWYDGVVYALIDELCMRVCRKLPSFAGRWTLGRRVYVALTRLYLCRGRSR